MTATSEPPTKRTWPEHHRNPSPTRWAPRGPRSSGPSIELSDSPPPPDLRCSRRARSKAAATIRVAAMGEMALTVTPDGTRRPSCHVSDATARLAQLYPPASAARHPDPEVTPRTEPDPAAAMRGRAARSTLRYPPRCTVQQSQPVFLAAVGEAGLPGDPGDVHHGVEAAVLVDQVLEQGTQSLTVGHRHRGGPGRATRRHDATGGGLVRLGEPLGAVEGHEGVDGDDEPAGPAQLLGDGRPDPSPAAGDDGDPLTSAHDAVDRTSSSRPSNVPASSQCSSRSR